MTINPYSADFIIGTLKENGLWLNQARGQNYLLSKEIAGKIVSLVPENASVFEVGSGLGALTLPLSEKFRTYSLEIDRGIYRALSGLLQNERLQIINADFLEYDMDSVPETELFFLSNLPYSISGEAVRKFIDCPKFKNGAVMLQEEFVDRMTASRGSDNYGVLSILSHFYLETKKVLTAGRNNFFPVPKVDSVVVTLRKKEFDIPQGPFNDFLRKCFLARRKTVLNNLKPLGFTKEKLEELGVDPAWRPENIPPDKWADLFREYEKMRC